MIRYSHTRRYFNPHPPRGGRPTSCWYCVSPPYFNPHPPRGGRHARRDADLCPQRISIHTPREGGDPARRYRWPRWRNFNPHPPRGGRLTQVGVVQRKRNLFQSTPPARGATRRTGLRRQSSCRFNPHPPRGGRPFVSIPCHPLKRFQSTPPARGATLRGGTGGRDGAISIHTPREGGDSLKLGSSNASEICFNPHPPRGGRRAEQDCGVNLLAVSIHTPREGGDRSSASPVTP